MPEFWAVRCFNCKAFVNQQKKKAKKWKCPICGSKQSVKRIYGKSDRAKDIRELIKELNANRAEYEREEQETKQEINEYLQYHNINNLEEFIQEQTEKQQQQQISTINRWTEFEDNKQQNHDNNDNDKEDDGMYVLQIPQEYKKKRGRGRRKRKNDEYQSIEPPTKKMKIIHHHNNDNKKENDDWNWDVWGDENHQNHQSENNKFEKKDNMINNNECKSFRNRFIGNYDKNNESDKSEDEETFFNVTQNNTADILLGGDIDDNKNNTNYNENIEITLQSQHEMDKSNIYETDINENQATTSKWSEYL